MKLSTYLYFNGNAKEALEFYSNCLESKIIMMMTYGQMPPEEGSTPGWNDKIVHGRLMVGNDFLMASDAPPDRQNGSEGFSVSVMVDTPEEADIIFAALSEGGNVFMPIEETFWAVRFGMVTDKFGVNWMVNCEKPMG